MTASFIIFWWTLSRISPRSLRQRLSSSLS